MKKEKSPMKKTDIFLIILGVFIVIGLAIGATYAFWKRDFTQEASNTGTVSCLKMTFTENTNAINLTGIYPVSDEVGRKNTPYTFTLKNECNQNANYTVSLETLAGTTLDAAYLAAVLDDGEVTKLSAYPVGTTVLSDSLESRILTQGKLLSKGSVTYNLRLWMPSDVTSTTAMSKGYFGKIIVTGTVAED